jgi:hypothetical protein
MKKLKLQMDDLLVESFATASAAGPRGTVEAHNTFRGNTCGAENTCGPQTCPPMYCVIETAFPCGGDSLNCTVGCPTPGCPVSGQMSCDTTCTTYDYTANLGNDTCGMCASFQSDSPQRCPCV